MGVGPEGVGLDPWLLLSLLAMELDLAIYNVTGWSKFQANRSFTSNRLGLQYQ